MKKIINKNKVIVLTLLTIILMLPIFKTTTATTYVSEIEPITQIDYLEPEIELPKTIKDNYTTYLDKLAMRESSNHWKVYNELGYMGKYQLGKLALKDIGMDSIQIEDFKKDPNVFPEYLQEIAVRKYTKKNQHYLRKYIKVYSGRTIKNIYITESGLLGAAHLVGHGSVKKWLMSNGETTFIDSNEVSIEEYLKLFSNISL